MKLHPFSWLLISLWITSLAVISNSLSLLCLLLGFAFVAGLLKRGLAIFPYLLGLKRLLPLILTLLLVQTVLRGGGKIIFSWGFLVIHEQGLQIGLEVALRLIILLVAAGILGGLNYIDFRNALIFLPQEFSFMISYVIHLVPMLRKRFVHYLNLLRLRGLEMKKLSWGKRLRIYRVISLSVLGSMLHSSERQSITLELRGFRSPGKKTFLYRQRPGWADLLLWLLLLLLSLGFLMISRLAD